MIWHKPNVPPRPEKDRLRLSHEHFFHFVIRPSKQPGQVLLRHLGNGIGVERRRHTLRTPGREWTYRNISRRPDTPAHPEQLPTWRHRPRSILRDGPGIGGVDRFRSPSHRIRHFLGLRASRIQSDEASPATNTGARSLTADPERGNFVSEWFGFRTYPAVRGGTDALRVQRARRCPFLTAATHEDRTCVKAASSSGICAINNASNGIRQDWLVCPYRALDPDLIRKVVYRLFNPESRESILIAPAPTLARLNTRAEFIEQLLAIKQVIATDPASIAYYALHEVPAWTFSDAGAAAAIVAAIRRRLSAWWSELGSAP